jgi:hypothetical protein
MRIGQQLFCGIFLAAACSSVGGDSDDTGTTGATGTTGEPAVCGDGVLDTSEACDVAAAGCDADCGLTGEVAWAVRIGDPDDRTTIFGVAVDATGQIVVFGEKLRTPGGQPIRSTWLLALDPVGEERWRKEFPGEEFPPGSGGVVVDGDGRIYVRYGGLRRFEPDGAPGWELPRPGPGDEYTAHVVGDDALFTADYGLDPEGGDTELANLIIRRHDPATGAIEWQRFIGDDHHRLSAGKLAVAGGAVVAAGEWYGYSSGGGGAVVSVDAATGAPGLRDYGESEGMYGPIAGLPSGDYVHTGWGDYRWFVRRHAGDGTIRWTVPIDVGESVGEHPLTDVVVGRDETIFVAANDGSWDAIHGTVRAVAGGGEPRWRVEFSPESPARSEVVEHLAIGPGFLVAAGASEGEVFQERTGWLRRIGPK